MTRMRPIRELYLSFEDGEAPTSFREILFFIAAGALETGKALHRIADAMERQAALREEQQCRRGTP